MNIAVLFAGGVGARMGGDIPKQFLEWNGKTILIQTIEAFEKHDMIDGIMLACKTEWIDFTSKLIEKAGIKKVIDIVPGGSTALDSQYNALKRIRELYSNDNPIVLIHDGVRPLVDANTITNCILCTENKGNAITVTQAIETVIRIGKNNKIVQILDRNDCRMAKAPQAFRLNDILNAHEKSIKEGNHAYIDSASMMIAQGVELYTVLGKPENIKITTPSDYYMYYGIVNSNNQSEGV